RAGIDLPVVDEGGRLQDRLDEQADRPVEVEGERGARRLIQRGQVGDLAGRERPPGRLEAAAGDELACAPRLGGRVRGRARQDGRQARRDVLGQGLRRELEVFRV